MGVGVVAHRRRWLERIRRRGVGVGRGCGVLETVQLEILCAEVTPAPQTAPELSSEQGTAEEPWVGWVRRVDGEEQRLHARHLPERFERARGVEQHRSRCIAGLAVVGLALEEKSAVPFGDLASDLRVEMGCERCRGRGATSDPRTHARTSSNGRFSLRAKARMSARPFSMNASRRSRNRPSGTSRTSHSCSPLIVVIVNLDDDHGPDTKQVQKTAHAKAVVVVASDDDDNDDPAAVHRVPARQGAESGRTVRLRSGAAVCRTGSATVTDARPGQGTARRHSARDWRHCSCDTGLWAARRRRRQQSDFYLISLDIPIAAATQPNRTCDPTTLCASLSRTAE